MVVPYKVLWCAVLLLPTWAIGLVLLHSCLSGTAWGCDRRLGQLEAPTGLGPYKCLQETVSSALSLCQEQTCTSHLSRNNLAGSEPALVQAAPGQAVQLFCPGNTAPEFQARWQKEGQPISSHRCV